MHVTKGNVMTQNSEKSFWGFIEGFQNAMVATVDGDTMRARPMVPFINKDDCEIRFLTHRLTHKTDEIKENSNALLTFSNPVTNAHASITGKIKVSEDHALIKELWGPYAETWFTGSPESRDVVAIVFKPEYGQMWNGEKNPVKLIKEVAVAFNSDTKIPDIVEEKKVNFG